MSAPASVNAALSGTRPNSAGYQRTDCPLCVAVKGSEDRGGSLWASASLGRWGCFRCDSGGKLDPEEIGLEPDAPQPERPAVALPEDWHPLGVEPGLSACTLAPARDYLAQRGVSTRAIIEAEVGACASGYAHGRIVVPIRRPDATLAGWVGRVWLDKEAADSAERMGYPPMKKYLYAKGTERILYNGQAAQVETDRPLLVVEGVFDTFPFWPDAVAVLGSWTGAHLAALCTAKRPVAVVLDGDAWRSGESLAMHLRLDGIRAGSVRLGPKADPDEDPDAVLRMALECVA